MYRCCCVVFLVVDEILVVAGASLLVTRAQSRSTPKHSSATRMTTRLPGKKKRLCVTLMLNKLCSPTAQVVDVALKESNVTYCCFCVSLLHNLTPAHRSIRPSPTAASTAIGLRATPNCLSFRMPSRTPRSASRATQSLSKGTSCSPRSLSL